MKTKEEILNGMIARFSSELLNVWNNGYRQGEYDGTQRANLANEGIKLQAEKEAYDRGVSDGAGLAEMHGSSATAKDRAKSFYRGVDEAMHCRKDKYQDKHAAYSSAYQHGYSLGYEDGTNDLKATTELIDELKQEEYLNGVQDLMEAVIAICCIPVHGGLYQSEIETVFGQGCLDYDEIFANHSGTEIIEKIQNYFNSKNDKGKD